MTFTGTTWNTPQTAGYLDNQAGVLWDPTATPIAPVLVPAAVTVSRGTNVTFSGDVFQQLGATAIALADGTQNSSVTGSSITDTAGGGISVGNVDDYFQDDTALMNSGDTLSGNEISFVGQNYSDTVGIFAGYTRALTITHNDIGYTPYSGLSLGWGWGWQSDCSLQAKQPLSVCRHGTDYAEANQITDNYIHDVMGVLYDGGPIYTNGGQGLGTGVSSGPCQQYSTVSGNVVADGNHTNNMLYHDEGSSCWNTYDNVSEFGGSDWVGMWTPTINTINIHDNYSDNASYNDNGSNITFNQATIFTGGAWPATARTLMSQAGVPSQSPAATGRIDDANLAVTYTGAWFDSGFRGLGDYDDDVHATTNNGDTASLTFYGTGITFYSETYTDEGVIGVTLDGAAQPNINAATPTRQSQQALYTVSGLSQGAHTLTLTKQSGTYMLVDRFDIQ